MKKTLVVGASLKPERFSNKAIVLLKKYGYPVVAYGMKTGSVADVEIFTEKIEVPDIHTVTMYINPQRQVELYDYILSLKPKRIIFNPNTENSEFKKMATDENIEVVEGCTLVMLNVGIF